MDRVAGELARAQPAGCFHYPRDIFAGEPRVRRSGWMSENPGVASFGVDLQKWNLGAESSGLREALGMDSIGA